MANIKKVAKYQNAPKPVKRSRLSDKDSMNIYANRYDELSASGVKKMNTDKKGSAKDLKAADEARKNENRLAKKLYGTTPSNKTGGMTKKKIMKMGGKIKKAQTGITESGPLSKVPEAGAMRKTKMKERSADGNYMSKTVTRETPAGSKTSTKVRRTAQGILRGAPKMNKYKMGGTLAPTKKSVGKTIGKLNKAKSGMKMSKMMSKMSKKK